MGEDDGEGNIETIARESVMDAWLIELVTEEMKNCGRLVVWRRVLVVHFAGLLDF